MTDREKTALSDLSETLRQQLGRFPFTMITLVILVIVALITGTHTGDLGPNVLDRLGFAPRDVWYLRWERVITSAVVTDGPASFWQAVVMVLLSAGGVEWLAGSWMAATAFWGVHVLTLLLQSLVVALPLHSLGLPEGTDLVFTRDVGPSAGYFGCLGFVCARLKEPWRRFASGGILLGLGVALIGAALSVQDRNIRLSAGIAHLIAFPLGWVLGMRTARKTGHVSPEKPLRL